MPPTRHHDTGPHLGPSEPRPSFKQHTPPRFSRRIHRWQSPTPMFASAYLPLLEVLRHPQPLASEALFPTDHLPTIAAPERAADLSSARTPCLRPPTVFFNVLSLLEFIQAVLLNSEPTAGLTSTSLHPSKTAEGILSDRFMNHTRSMNYHRTCFFRGCDRLKAKLHPSASGVVLFFTRCFLIILEALHLHSIRAPSTRRRSQARPHPSAYGRQLPLAPKLIPGNFLKCLFSHSLLNVHSPSSFRA